MDIQEASTPVAASTRIHPRVTTAPGAVLLNLLREGLTQSGTAIKAGSVPIVGDVEWTSMCAVAHRCRIAPIVYQCLRATSLPVPRDVMDWFRVQYYDTVARNLASLNELRAVLGAFSAAGIPAIVFKGPALAHFGNEMARSWQDLDILIRGEATERAEALLLRNGYTLLPAPPLRNHRRYGPGSDARRGVLEIHVDISDPLRSHRPDIEAIWGRAADTKILGLSARVPDLTDHLLLTIMQLPHHHWSLRLLIDIWQVIARWQGDIYWDELFRRAHAWQMMALTTSAFSILSSKFGVALPDAVREKAHPLGYYDRLHREIASQAIDEQLEYPFQPRVMWLAPFVVVDRASRVPAILIRRLLAGGEAVDDGRVGKAFRRNMTSLAALPAVFRVLLTSLSRSPGRRR